MPCLTPCHGRNAAATQSNTETQPVVASAQWVCITPVVTGPQLYIQHSHLNMQSQMHNWHLLQHFIHCCYASQHHTDAAGCQIRTIQAHTTLMGTDCCCYCLLLPHRSSSTSGSTALSSQGLTSMVRSILHYWAMACLAVKGRAIVCPCALNYP